VSLFAGFRAAFIGILGAIAVMVGGAFFGFQKSRLDLARRCTPRSACSISADGSAG
jgi:hypothetical protein